MVRTESTVSSVVLHALPAMLMRSILQENIELNPYPSEVKKQSMQGRNPYHMRYYTYKTGHGMP